MNAVTTTKPNAISRRPTDQSRPMADLVAKFTNRLEDAGGFNRRCISAVVAPQEHERAALQVRKAELLASLEPDGDRARKVLVALLGSFPSYGEDEETARFILSACCRACAKAPAWALEEASARFLEGRTHITWNMANRPTPPQILAEALQCALPVEAELHKLSTVLDAEIVDIETTDAERQDAMDAWAKLRSEIGSSNVLSERTPEEITRERNAMAEANTRFRVREAAHLASMEAKAKASESAA